MNPNISVMTTDVMRLNLSVKGQKLPKWIFFNELCFFNWHTKHKDKKFKSF